MKSDSELRSDVENELSWEPSVISTHIGVAVDGSVVTLSGHVSTWAEKWNAERAAKRVLGVKGLANEIDVHLSGSHERSDTDIAKAAVHALQWRTTLPEDRVKVTVKDGCLSLDGEVELRYQRQEAENAVRYLTGVRRVTNNIYVEAPVKPGDVKKAIRDALTRSARLDAEQIQVEARGNTIVLRGEVSSWVEMDEAEEAAWAAPGVSKVENHLTVG